MSDQPSVQGPDVCEVCMGSHNAKRGTCWACCGAGLNREARYKKALIIAEMERERIDRIFLTREDVEVDHRKPAGTQGS